MANSDPGTEELSLVDNNQTMDINSNIKDNHIVTREQRVELFYFALASTLIIVSVVFSIEIEENVPVYHIISYISAALLIVYFMIVFRTLLNIKHFHLIIVERVSFSSYNSTILIPCNKIKEYHSMPVKSLSALYATHGTSLHEYNLYITCILIGISLCVGIIKLDDINTDFNNDPSLITFFISIYGWSMVEIFELDTFNRKNISFIMHWIGAFISFFGFPLTFALQQNFNLFSISLLSLSYLFNFLFIVIGHIILPNSHTNPKIVDQIGAFSILTEFTSLGIVGICICLYIFNS